jgi:hypothetical protein
MPVEEFWLGSNQDGIKKIFMTKINPKYDKIFGIGLSRTGTTSLHFALKILGFRLILFVR